MDGHMNVELVLFSISWSASFRNSSFVKIRANYLMRWINTKAVENVPASPTIRKLLLERQPNVRRHSQLDSSQLSLTNSSYVQEAKPDLLQQYLLQVFWQSIYCF
jgi:hypothetical protein